MSDIPEWEKMEASGEWSDYGDMAREFARRHCKAALEAAGIIANQWENSGELKPLILNAYSENLIQ